MRLELKFSSAWVSIIIRFKWDSSWTSARASYYYFSSWTSAQLKPQLLLNSWSWTSAQLKPSLCSMAYTERRGSTLWPVDVRALQYH